MTVSIREIRVRLYRQQDGKCFACGQDMWERGLETRAEFTARMAELGIKIGCRKIKRVACTLDHHIPKSQGGRDNDGRNKAMCRDCNKSRGDMPMDEFLKLRRAA